LDNFKEKKKVKIVVIGAGLSGLGAAYRMQSVGHEVTVLERNDRPGGRCKALHRDGFIIDTCPEIAATSYKRWLALVREVGLGDEVVSTTPVISILRAGRMVDINIGRTISGALSMLFTPALSWRGKLRFLSGLHGMREQLRSLDCDNLLASAELDDPNSNAEEFAVRALGREAAEYLIDPLMRSLGGSKMSTVSTLMVPYALSGWSDPLITLRGGLDRLPKAVASKLNVLYSTDVRQVRSTASGATVEYVDASGTPCILNADKCLITTQYPDAVRMYPRFKELGGNFASELKAANLMDVKIAYNKATRSKAWLANTPTIEDPELMCFMLSHNKSPDRAPHDHSLFTVVSDHAAFDHLNALNDEQLIVWARKHMENFYPEVRGHFLFGHVNRAPFGACFSDPGFYRRTAKLWEAIGTEPHVHLGGDMMNGASMEAALVGGERAADRLTAISRSI
jgi:protoporphyrinogen oxidase